MSKYIDAYLVISQSVDGYVTNYGAYINQQKAIDVVEHIEKYHDIIEVWIEDITIDITEE